MINKETILMNKEEMEGELSDLQKVKEDIEGSILALNQLTTETKTSLIKAVKNTINQLEKEDKDLIEVYEQDISFYE